MRFATSTLNRRVLDADKGHLYPQQPSECRSQVPRVVFHARGHVVVGTSGRESRLDSLKARCHVVDCVHLLRDESSSIGSLEVRMKEACIIARILCNGPLAPVPLEKTVDVVPPTLHEENVGWSLRRRFRGELQLCGILDCVGEPLDSREHVAVHEGEIRRKAAVASECNTDDHSRGRDLHGDERGQTPSDGNGPRAHKSSEARPQLDLVFFYTTALRRDASRNQCGPSLPNIFQTHASVTTCRDLAA